MKYTIILFLFILGIFASSCTDKNVVTNQFTETEEKAWSEKDTFVFDFTIPDETFEYDIFLNLRISSDYKYANLYMQAALNASHEIPKFSRKQVLLASPDGKWFGTGRGELITIQVPLYEKHQFLKAGKQRLYLSQEMRDLLLENVAAVGVKVVKGNPVF